MKPLNSMEILNTVIETGVKKADGGILKLSILGFLAGGFIAMAAAGSNMVAFNLLMNPDTYGLGRGLAGALFSVGLMLVVAAGAELFTGNTMMAASLFDKKISFKGMMRNWAIVYITNLLGSLFIAYIITTSGLLDSGGHLLGALTVKIAVGKTGLTFHSAFLLGILCNWLVCLGVYIAYGADTMSGKLLGCFFPIWLFVTSGFEHSVANMYYIPAGLMAKTMSDYSLLSQVTAEALANLNLYGFFITNLVPVTLGNIVGGSIFVAGAYYLAYKEK